MSLPVVISELYQPPVQEVISLFRDALKQNFEKVSVEWTKCPDLSVAPFHLAASGICGDNTIVDIGGVPNLLPVVQRHKLYNLDQVVDLCGMRDKALVIGACAASFKEIGKNAEMIANCYYLSGKKSHLSKVALLNDDDDCSGSLSNCSMRHPASTDFALLGNFSCSRGENNFVVAMEVSKWKESSNKAGHFVDVLREALQEKYKNCDLPVAMSGIFQVQPSVSMHIMPDFSSHPLPDSAVNSWLKFFEFPGPMNCVGTFVSHDPQNWHLRLEHFHGWNAENNLYGGHYHNDVGKGEASYLCYLSFGARLARIDDAF